MKKRLLIGLGIVLAAAFLYAATTTNIFLGTKTVLTSTTISSTTNYVLVVQGTGTNAPYRLMSISNLMAVANNRVDPFCVIDNVAFYPTNPWVCVIDERWLGDPTSATAAQEGAYAWNIYTGGSGTAFSRAPITTLQDVGGYLTLQTTSLALRAVSTLNTNLLSLTNYETIIWQRIAVDNTNVLGEIRTSRGGWASTPTMTTAELGAGAAYWMINTNVNTNSFVLITGVGGSTTITYSQHGSNTFSKNTFINVGIWSKADGTNNVLIVGLTPTNFVSVATNTANAPRDTLLAPFFATYAVTAGGGTNRSNYFGTMKGFRRPTSANF